MSDNQPRENLPPAYFLSLTLENVRCFGPEQTLDLSDDEGRPAQWTVLLGDNGTGKTTLLQALAALEIDVEWDHETKELLVGNLPEEEISRQRRPAIMELQFLRGWVPFVRSSMNRARLRARYFSGTRLSEQRGGKELRPAFEVWETGVGIHLGAEGFPEREGTQGLFCVGYGASRTMREGGVVFSKEGFSEEYERAKATAGLFSDTESLPNVEEWLHELNYSAAKGNRKAEERLDQVKFVLANSESGILPDVDDLHFEERDEDTSPPQIEFHTPYGWVTIDQLSLGYRTMIAWVVDLARRLFDRYPESDNPLAEPAVCLVDEIDLHLHPKWQRKIIDFLSERFPNTQFIVTAHSPLVVQAAQDANIALMKRVEVEDGDDYVEIENDPARIRNWRVDQILTSDLFDLESARPPQADKLMQEREEILAQEELTEEDRKRLEELEEKIGDLPTGETPDDIEAMNLIRQAARRLKEDS